MIDQITLRPVRPEDQKIIFNVFTDTRANLFEHSGLAQQQIESIVEMQFHAQWAQYHAQFPKADYHLILTEEKPIGYCYVDRSEDCFVLVDIALLPAQTGKGIGSQIVSSLITEAFNEGKYVSAHVEKLNDQALKLWRRLGFQQVNDDGIYLEIECRPDAATSP